jgi:2-haloalkanoic acid dehalogenase type II
MIKAIIFDVFGTLIDTKDGSIRATEAILKKNKSKLDSKVVYGEWKKLYGASLLDAKGFIKEEEIFLRGLEIINKQFDLNCDVENDVKIMLQSRYNREAFEEARFVIEELKKKYKVYIGSNTDNDPLFANLKQNNISVDECFTSEMLMTYKPNRGFFEKMLRKLNLHAEEAIYVGDSQIDDVLGAKALGIQVVWVNRKNQVLRDNIPKPDYEVCDLREMFNFL